MTDTFFEILANCGHVEPGEGVRCDVRGRAVALFNIDGRLHAIDNRCSHGQASLADGWVEGCEVECPLHQGRFDVTNGKATAAPCVEDVASYPVRVDGDQVWITVPGERTD